MQTRLQLLHERAPVGGRGPGGGGGAGRRGLVGGRGRAGRGAQEGPDDRRGAVRRPRALQAAEGVPQELPRRPAEGRWRRPAGALRTDAVGRRLVNAFGEDGLIFKFTRTFFAF